MIEHSPKEFVIYRAKNNVNSKCYVGQTDDFEFRKHIHLREALAKRKKDSSPIFYSAIRKYGSDTFEWSILCKCNSKDDLNLAEQIFIAYYKEKNLSYNIGDGGTGGWGLDKHPDIIDIKKKMSESAIRVSEEINRPKLMSNEWKKRKQNPEWMAWNKEKMQERFRTQNSTYNKIRSYVNEKFKNGIGITIPEIKKQFNVTASTAHDVVDQIPHRREYVTEEIMVNCNTRGVFKSHSKRAKLFPLEVENAI